MGVKFSVVMTVFGTYEFLPRGVACLMDQSYGEWELLVVSDGPVPRMDSKGGKNREGKFGPRRVLEPLRMMFPEKRIEFFELDRAEGCWGNRGRAYGLQEARGEYVCWVNHDNLIGRDYLKQHAENVARRPGCLSVVDIHLWIGDRYRGRYPRAYRCGRIDLLCYAIPCETARRVEAFGSAMERIYAADGKVFEACARELEIEHTREAAGHHF